MNAEKITMTTEETASLLRDAGIHIDVETLREGIKQGAFPFGVAIKRNSWVFLIYRNKVKEYLQSIGC